MRKAYKWVIAMTVLVVTASGCILLMSGRTAQMTDTPLFVAQYALYNIYLYMVAFLYSPSLNDQADYAGIVG